MNETILIAVLTALTSSGACSIILYLIQRHALEKDKSSAAEKLQSDMLMRGYITQDEYENLHEYLYKPYAALGGNGTAKRIMAEVEKLPLHKE